MTLRLLIHGLSHCLEIGPSPTPAGQEDARQPAKKSRPLGDRQVYPTGLSGRKPTWPPPPCHMRRGASRQPGSSRRRSALLFLSAPSGPRVPAATRPAPGGGSRGRGAAQWAPRRQAAPPARRPRSLPPASPCPCRPRARPGSPPARPGAPRTRVASGGAGTQPSGPRLPLPAQRPAPPAPPPPAPTRCVRALLAGLAARAPVPIRLLPGPAPARPLPAAAGRAAARGGVGDRGTARKERERRAGEGNETLTDSTVAILDRSDRRGAAASEGADGGPRSKPCWSLGGHVSPAAARAGGGAGPAPGRGAAPAGSCSRRARGTPGTPPPGGDTPSRGKEEAGKAPRGRRPMSAAAFPHLSAPPVLNGRWINRRAHWTSHSPFSPEHGARGPLSLCMLERGGFSRRPFPGETTRV